MATVFSDWLSDALKRAHVIQGDGYFVTSTVTSTATGLVATGLFESNSALAIQSGMMRQVANEVVQEVFSMGLLPKIASTATISLVAQQREYTMPTDFERMAGETFEQRQISGATTGLSLFEYPGGYMQMLADQPRATDFTGQPSAWAISPGSGSIRFDREPTSAQSGQTYNFIYEKVIHFTATSEADALPFSSSAADQLVPVLAEAWNKSNKGQFDIAEYRRGIARAIGFMSETRPADRWGGVRRG